MEYLVFEDIENENFNINTDFVSISSTGNIEPVKKKGSRLQHYRPAWELNPLFENWLVQGNNSRRAKCSVCNSQLTADISALKYHASSMKHREAMTQEFGDAFTVPKVSSMKSVRRGFYNPLWESDEKYGSWIMQGSSELYAYCRLCKLDMPANTSTLKRHMFTQTHIKATDFDEKLHSLQSQTLSGESIVLQNLNATIEEHDQEVAKLQEICLSANLSNPEETIYSFTEVAAPSSIFQYTNDRSKLMDELSLQIGKLLMRGYKMLNETCKCECVLMENKKGSKTCVGCQSGIMEEVKVKSNSDGANLYLPPVKFQIPLSCCASPDSILGNPFDFPVNSYEQDRGNGTADNACDIEQILVKEEIDDSATQAEIVINEAEDGEMNSYVERIYGPEQTMKLDEEMDSDYLSSMLNGETMFQKEDLHSEALTTKRVLTNLIEQLERNENISNSLKSIETTVTALVKLKNS